MFAGKIGAPQRHRHDLRAAGDERVAHHFIRGKFSRADEQPRSEFAIGNFQLGRLIRHHGNIFAICRLRIDLYMREICNSVIACATASSRADARDLSIVCLA